MSIPAPVPGPSRPELLKKILAVGLSFVFLFATLPENISAGQDQNPPPPPPPQSVPQGQQAPPPPYTQQTPEQLQQLVAPIALYPDSLVAQILAASTYPEQVVEADRFLQSQPNLKGDALAKAVDQQPWDPSVKALTAFPSVLGNMDKNLSWTSSLGDAYYNQQQDVMDAVQVMRQRADQAGNLKSTPQQTVTTQGSTIVIQPASPTVVYVPAYDPWSIYGPPIAPWPGWYPYPGIWYAGPYLTFGIGFPIGFFGGFVWGWPHWGFDWHNRVVIYNRGRYFSRSNVFYNRNAFYRGGFTRGGIYNRPGAVVRPFGGDARAVRGYAAPRGQAGMRSGAFGGYDRGGQVRSFSSRGQQSFGGGGFRGGGGGGFRGGGGRR